MLIGEKEMDNMVQSGMTAGRRGCYEESEGVCGGLYS